METDSRMLAVLVTQVAIADPAVFLVHASILRMASTTTAGAMS